MIPLLCVLFLRVKRVEEGFDSLFYRVYRRALISALRFRWITVMLALGVFYAAMQGLAYIPNIFFPPSDKPMFTVEIEAPTGTPIERTQRIVAAVDGFVETNLRSGDDRAEGVTTWSAYIGQGAPRFTLSYGPEQTRPEYAYLIVNTTSTAVIPAISARLDEFLTQEFPDLRTVIQPLQNGPVVKHPIEIRLVGDDTDRLFEIVDGLKAHMQSLSGVRGIGDDWGARTKKLVVDVDNARARRAGLSNQDVATSLMSSLTGLAVTDYREGDEVIPVTMRSKDDDRQQIARLETLNVYSQQTGRSVPLQAVADLNVVWQPAKIFRRNRLKAVTVFSNLAPGVTAAETTNQIVPWLDERSDSWPLGFRYELGGELEASSEGNESIAEKLPVAGLAILLLLVGQFNSIRRPLIILLTIPLGLIGVVIGLLITGSYMGFMTFLGVISLSGIVINNAIVLLDRIDIEINRNGLPPDRAVIEAAQRRLRPILLTTADDVRRSAAAVVGRRGDVRADGDRHPVRLDIRHSPDAGRGTRALLHLFRNQLQRLRHGAGSRPLPPPLLEHALTESPASRRPGCARWRPRSPGARPLRPAPPREPLMLTCMAPLIRFGAEPAKLTCAGTPPISARTGSCNVSMPDTILPSGARRVRRPSRRHVDDDGGSPRRWVLRAVHAVVRRDQRRRLADSARIERVDARRREPDRHARLRAQDATVAHLDSDVPLQQD